MTVQVKQLTTEQQLQLALATIAQLQAQVTAKAAPKALSAKPSAKGALSVYGLGRWPVTLYKGQWETLLAQQEVIKAALTQHAAVLTSKGE